MRKVYYLNSDFKLELNESSYITLIIDSDLINIDYELSNGDFNILVFNNSQKDLVLNEKGNVKNASLNITYIELNDAKYKQNNTLNVYKDSSLNINSIYLGVNVKNIVFNMYNLESNSLVKITNNVVCLDDADFSLDIIGNIVKKAKNSKCHQKSQCLTFGSPKKARVLPVLNIDENDVEASHSLSSGTIDEEVLFYMNARGLNAKDALSLLLTSYLMPSEEFYKDYEDGLKIKDIADKKVSKIC